MTKSRGLKLEQGRETVVTHCSRRARYERGGLTSESAVEANNVDESMSFFRGSETFGRLSRRDGRVQDFGVFSIDCNTGVVEQDYWASVPCFINPGS